MLSGTQPDTDISKCPHHGRRMPDKKHQHISKCPHQGRKMHLNMSLLAKNLYVKCEFT